MFSLTSELIFINFRQAAGYTASGNEAKTVN